MVKTTIEVGSNLRGVLDEVAAAWRAAEAGAPVPADDKLCFVDWAALRAVLTPKRYELVRALRNAPAAGVRPLARALGRDVKRVHADVVALEELGLIERDRETGALSASFHAISSTTPMPFGNAGMVPTNSLPTTTPIRSVIFVSGPLNQASC